MSALHPARSISPQLHSLLSSLCTFSSESECACTLLDVRLVVAHPSCREGLIKWVSKKTGPPAITIDTAAKLDELESTTAVSVLAYFPKFEVRCGPCSSSNPAPTLNSHSARLLQPW